MSPDGVITTLVPRLAVASPYPLTPAQTKKNAGLLNSTTLTGMWDVARRHHRGSPDAQHVAVRQQWSFASGAFDAILKCVILMYVLNYSKPAEIAICEPPLLRNS